MIPLAVEFIVIVVDVRPPAVIMRKYRHAEQHDHRVTYFVLQNQIDLPLGAFVQSDHAQHDENPYFQRILRCIEVHVLVGCDARFVGTF